MATYGDALSDVNIPELLEQLEKLKEKIRAAEEAQQKGKKFCQ